MIQPLTVLALMVLVCGLPGCAEAQEESSAITSLDDPKQEESYAVGLSFGRSLADQGVDVDLDILMQGLRDGISDAESLLDDEKVQAAMIRLQQQVVSRQREQQQALAETSKADSAAFLEQNAQREGVTVLPSGLQYEILQPGDGASPSVSDQVTVHYRGSLVDGTEFDSSYERDQPVTLKLDQVIRGWTEGIPLMKVGGKWKFFIPSELGYGERGGGQVIPPHAALIFEVELLSIGEPAAAGE